MGKKRFNSSVLTKIHASSASPSSISSSNQNKSTQEASVSDRLSQLRLEGLRHERNTSNSGPVLLDLPSSTRGDREISELLGHTYVQPAPRIKLRNSGHRAPRSWQTYTPTRRAEPIAGTDKRNRSDTLVARCLEQISRAIEQYLGCGMEFLPGYLKSQLLANVSNVSQTVLEDIWSDLLPQGATDESITILDLHRAQLPRSATLKRLEALHSVVVSSLQAERGIILALPSVLQEVTIIQAVLPQGDQVSYQQAQQISWRKISRHLIAARSLRIQSTTTEDDPDTSRTLVALIKTLETSIEWETVFETLKLITIQCACTSSTTTFNDITCAVRLFQESLRQKRRRGRHIEVKLLHTDST